MMAQPPVFAVVGHPNKGKSSVVATLSQNDAIAIALEPGTTRKCQAYPLSVDGQLLYTLVDTPGFQRPRRVLQWLQAHSLSAADHAETVAAFVQQHRGDKRFVDECELLTPVIAGAGIIYVVDGSVPYSAEHEAEMAILRWTGQPSLALINSIGEGDYRDVWQSALAQFFQVVRHFDAVRAPFTQHLELLRTFGQLAPDWERPVEQAISLLAAQRQQRQRQAARLIAQALQALLSHQEKLALTPGRTEDAQLEGLLSSRWYHHQRTREQALRTDIEHLYQHQHLQCRETELQWAQEHDLFAEQTRQHWAVSKGYLAAAGFGVGAVSGVGIDAVTFGSSLGTGALLGGVIGAAGSYFYGDRLLFPALKIGPLRDGVKSATFGPAQDAQFGYIVLGRAVNHWWHVAHRNHAGRDLLALESGDQHWLEQLDKPSRHNLQQLFDRLRKQKPLSHQQQSDFAAIIEKTMIVYADWRLNRC